ncbi:MAG: hypothetical protein K2N19_05615, partial [Muribaculaceae bacterium]|nr:hypothetical protein [Muribaculaceae bacterium]
MAIFLLLLVSIISIAQYRKSELDPPPPAPEPQYVQGTDIPDSVLMPSPVSPTMPRGYNALLDAEYAADLSDPSNIKTEAIYDPESGMY